MFKALRYGLCRVLDLKHPPYVLTLKRDSDDDDHADDADDDDDDDDDADDDAMGGCVCVLHVPAGGSPGCACDFTTSPRR